MSKKKQTTTSENNIEDVIKSLKIENRILALDRENLKLEIMELKSVIIGQSIQIQRNKNMTNIEIKRIELDSILSGYEGNYGEYGILDDGTITNIDPEPLWGYTRSMHKDQREQLKYISEALKSMLVELTQDELDMVEDFITNECNDSEYLDDDGNYPNIYRMFITNKYSG